MHLSSQTINHTPEKSQVSARDKRPDGQLPYPHIQHPTSRLRTLAAAALLLLGTTAWGQQALPYTYGFENNNLATDGWTQTTTNASSGIYNTGAHGGSYHFRFQWSENPGYLRSPRLTGTESGVHLSFYYKNYGTSYVEQFQVGYTTANNTDPSTYTYGATIYGTSNWLQYETDLPANTQYVAIKYIYTDGYYLMLDDFEFTSSFSGLIMANGLTQTIECATTYNFYDNGGPTGNYTNINTTHTATFTSTGNITINFSQFETESTGSSNWDNIKIYDGTVATGTPLVFGCTGWTNGLNGAAAGFSQLLATGTDYTCTSGTMTVVWKADNTNNAAGWAATITATGCPAPDPCTPTLTSSTTTYYISRFQTTGANTNINNTTSGTGASYSNFYNSVAAVADAGATIGFTITIAGGGTHGSAIWIDWNRNGTFETTERVWNTTSYTSSPHTGSFTIPTDADGDYRMRVVSDYLGSNPSNPCSANTGEFEDYKLTVSGCTSRTASISGCPAVDVASGGTVQLTGSVSAGGGAVTWTSSSPAAATVSAGGLVTALAPGTTTITYTRAANGAYCAASATCNINVVCATNTQPFAFSTTAGTVTEDATLTIETGWLTVPAGATVTSYTSDNTSIATVTNAGVVTGVSAGTAHITATIAQWTYNGVTYCQRTTTNTFTVTVTGDGCAKVGNETNQTSDSPIYTYWAYYGYTQQIYTAAELTAAGACRGVVSSIKFQYKGRNSDPVNLTVPIEIYIGSTSQSDLSTEWVTDGNLTLVYNNSVTCSPGWMNIPLSTPYEWDGESNIVIAIRTTGSFTNYDYYFYGTSIANMTRYASNSSEMIALESNNVPGDLSGSTATYRPNVKFCIDCCTERGAAAHITNSCPIELPYGSTVQLNGTVDVGVGDISWSSSNTDAATVSGSGLVSAVTMGSATITYRRAYDGTYCAASTTCVVNVVVPTPTVEQTDDPLPECGDGNATLVASVSSVPSGYTFHWYTNSTCTDEITAGVSGTNNNTLSYPATNATQVWCRLEKPGSTTTQTFDYTGEIQTYTVPADAESLTLEVWGAQGGSYNGTYSGGRGGYMKGTLANPTAGSTLYVVVGGQPAAYTTTPTSTTGVNIPGGYNGGGSAVTHYYSLSGNIGWSLPQGGGGATHIATVDGLLNTMNTKQDKVLIVAGGGSGGVYCYGTGSVGLNGYTGFAGYAGGGSTSDAYSDTYRATQTAAGSNGSFGQGASLTTNANYRYGSSGGGGGWYGGGRNTFNDTYSEAVVHGHGGGSGHFNAALTGTQETNGSRTGNGQAKITADIPMMTGSAASVTVKCCGIDTQVKISAP